VIKILTAAAGATLNLTGFATILSSNGLISYWNYSWKDLKQIRMVVFFGWGEYKHVIWLPLEQCCGSGIRCFFTPWIRDPDPGWIFPDPGYGPFFDEIFLQYLQNPCYVIFITLAYSWNFLIKSLTAWKSYAYLCYPFFYIGLGSGIRDLGSGMNKYSDPDLGSGIKHPGSATLFGDMLTQKLFSAIFVKSNKTPKCASSYIDPP
jgi:hypothetical protein